MKMIVAGSRGITYFPVVQYILDPLKNDIDEVVCGLAKGVDFLGKQWAIKNNLPTIDFPADWAKYGKGAGPLRNKQMGEYADSAVIIWDGLSRGSQNMANIMKQLKKPHRVFKITVEIEEIGDDTIEKVYRCEDGTQFREQYPNHLFF